MNNLTAADHQRLRDRVAELEARLRAIATAKPMEGEPLWHFFDRVQSIASQADGETKS